MSTRPPLIASALLAASLFSGAAQSAISYTYTDLGTLGGGDSYAFAINNSGQIVGFSSAVVGSTNHATLWSGNNITDLGTLGGNDSLAYGINDLGQIVGSSTTTANAATHATLWSGGNITDLDPLVGSGGSTAYAINSSGQIVGESSYASATQATLWVGNSKTNLGSLVSGQVYSSASDINESGQIVGLSSSLYGGYRPILWNGGNASGLTELSNFTGGGTGEAFSINSFGQIAGHTINVHGYPAIATVWDGSNITVLLPAGWSQSWAYAINETGQVAGRVAGYSSTHAALWSDGNFIDLNSFLDADLVNASWLLSSAEDINDNGWIVGTARNSITGESHAYLLTPVPEPETYAMFLAGLGLVGFMARRRKPAKV